MITNDRKFKKVVASVESGENLTAMLKKYKLNKSTYYNRTKKPGKSRTPSLIEIPLAAPSNERTLALLERVVTIIERGL